MATTKTAKTASTYDLATGSGFVQAFDAEFEKLQSEKGWCGRGRELAYEKSGIPAPNRRTTSELDNLASLSRYFTLNAEGQALVEQAKAEQDAKLEQYKAGAVQAALYALNEGQITLARANQVMAALGLPKLATAKRHGGYTTISIYYTTSRQLTDAECKALNVALAAGKAAVQAAMPADAGVTWSADNPGNGYTSSDRSASSTYVPVTDQPDEVPAETTA